MKRTITFKMYQLFCATIMAFTAALITFAQTQERVVDGKSPDTQKTQVGRHRISGIVTMRVNNQPVVKALIRITGIDRPVAETQNFTNQTFTDEQGRWTVDKVPDGNYLIVVDPAITIPPANNKNGQVNEANPAADAKFVTQSHEVKVSGTDIDDLAMQVIKGGRITGKVIMDGGEMLPKDLIILPEQAIKDGRSPIRIAPVQSDGSFILEGVPTGEIILKVVVYGKPKEYYMKTATVNGIDLLRETLNIQDGAEVKDAHIVFAKVANK